MPPSPDLPDALIELLDSAEDLYPAVTLDHLRRLARADPDWAPLTRKLSRLLSRALAADMVLSDNRTHLTRRGTFSPVRLYRLNRRHPAVIQALGDEV